MARFETWFRADLTQPQQVHAVRGNVFTQDNMANRVGVQVYDDAEPVTLEGSVMAYVIRADDATVACPGEKEGNAAWVDLPESAYAVPGLIQIAIRLTNGDNKTVLTACTGYVTKSTTDTIIDPGEVIPDISELLACIDDCEAAAAAANGAADAATAAAADAENVNISQSKSGDEITITTTDRDGVETSNTIRGGGSSITDTASGAIASFPDGADGEPMESVKVGIEPVQDLHGYANPWPAGGGKNKVGTFEYGTVMEGTSAGATYDQVKTARNARARSTVLIPTPSQFTVSMDFSIYRYGIMFFDANQLYLGSTTGWRGWLSSANTYTPTNSAYAALVFRRTDDANLTEADFANCKIQLEFNSSATTYEPYSNVCPIIGWTGANVSRTGVNVWDEVWENGDISSSDGSNSTNPSCIRAKNYIPVLPGMKLYIKSSNQGSNNAGNLKGRYYTRDKTFIGYSPTMTVGDVITIPANCYFIRFACQSNYGTTYKNDISINYPSTDTAYHAYTGTTYPITWTEAGTVYGGELDATTGVLTVKWGIRTLNGGETWTKQTLSQGVTFYCANDYLMHLDVYTGKIYADKLDVRPTHASWTVNDKAFISGYYDISNQYPNRNWFYVHIDGITDVNDLKTWLTANNVTVVYRLKDNITYQLTPTQITSLLGQNNVWADTGDTEATYKADTKLYIDKKLAALAAQIVNA